MAHEYDGRLTVVIFLCDIHHAVLDPCKILIGIQEVYAKIDVHAVGILGPSLLKLPILNSRHQMGGLYDKSLYAIVNGPFQGFLYVVDLLAVSSLDMIDDDLGGKGAPYRPVREGFLDGRLDAADGFASGIIVAGAKADDQDLFFTDLILIQRIVQRGVTCRVVLLVILFLLCSIFLCRLLQSFFRLVCHDADRACRQCCGKYHTGKQQFHCSVLHLVSSFAFSTETETIPKSE